MKWYKNKENFKWHDTNANPHKLNIVKFNVYRFPKEKEMLWARPTNTVSSIKFVFSFSIQPSQFIQYKTVNGYDFIMQRKQYRKNIKQKPAHIELFHSLKTELYKHNHVQRSISVTRNIHNSQSSCSMRSNELFIHSKTFHSMKWNGMKYNENVILNVESTLHYAPYQRYTIALKSI